MLLNLDLYDLIDLLFGVLLRGKDMRSILVFLVGSVVFTCLEKPVGIGNGNIIQSVRGFLRTDEIHGLLELLPGS